MASYTEMYNQMQFFSDNWSRKTFIVGDFNSRSKTFGDHVTERRGKELEILLDEQIFIYCKPKRGLYTTNKNNGRGVTDLILANDTNLIENLEVHEKRSLGNSDHRPLTWNVTLQSNLQNGNRKKWNIFKLTNNKECLEKYQQILKLEIPTLEESNDSEDIDTNWKKLEEWINHALKNSCGYKQEFKLKKSILWTPDLKNQSETLDELAQNYSSDGVPTSRIFKRYMKNWENRKENIIRDQLDKICNNGSRNEFFKLVKRMNFRSKQKYSYLEACNISNYTTHFKQTFGGSPNGNIEFYDPELLQKTKRCSEFELEDDIEAFTKEEVQVAIRKLGRGKAAGMDNLPAEAFTCGGQIIVDLLTVMFNQMRNINYTPKNWNKALVCLIYKNKGEKDDIANYRPISLTIVAKRIFEKIIDARLNCYKEKLHPYQAGFRPGRSTVDQIYYLQEIYEMNKAASRDTISVFLDLKAAYDCVDRNILWTKLKNKYNIPLGLIKIIRSMFDYNNSHLLVESMISDGIPNLRGVPQGSSLSPIMFNFYIDDLITELHNNKEKLLPSSCLFFADDGNLHSTNKDQMQKLLQICKEWSNNFGLSFAAKKCFVISKRDVELKLGTNETLPQTDQTKYLGIHFNENGANWKDSVSQAVKKAKRTIMTLVKLGLNHKKWDPSSSINVFKLFIRPMMEYAIQGVLLAKAEIDLMQRTQFLALRIILGTTWNTSKSAMAKLACLESMECRNLILNASYVSKTLKKEDRTNPTFNLMNELKTKGKSLIGKWIHKNKFIERLQQSENIKEDIHKIKYENVSRSNFGATAVSDSIVIPNTLQHSSILKWKDSQDAIQKRQVIKWRLGRIAYHQMCLNCESKELSRKHALKCAGIDDFIAEKFKNFERDEEHLSLDKLLNHYYSTTSKELISIFASIIANIKWTCLNILE
ncbi:MAG: hypothetical protein RL348_1776 [Bacteroidota bacterium]